MTAIARFMRYGAEQTEQFDTVDEALRFLAWGEDAGTLSSEHTAVTDDSGNTLATKDDVMETWEKMT